MSNEIQQSKNKAAIPDPLTIHLVSVVSSSPSNRTSDTDIENLDRTPPAVSPSPRDKSLPRPRRVISRRRRTRWKKQYEKRLLSNTEDGVGTTDEERSPEDILRFKTVSDRERLKLLPRPSLVVPDIHLGHRQDAGMTDQLREAHERKMKATVLRLHNYDRNGSLMMISETTRQHHGLELYSPFLHPPPCDRHVHPRRVPKMLLSRYYRGKILTRRFTRNIKTSLSQTYDASKLDDHPFNQASDSPLSQPSDYILDFDYWCPTSEYEKQEHKRVEARAELARQTAHDTAQRRARRALGVPSHRPSKKRKSFATGDVEVVSKLSNSEIVNQLLNEESQSDDSEPCENNNPVSEPLSPGSVPDASSSDKYSDEDIPMDLLNEQQQIEPSTPPLDEIDEALQPPEPKNPLFDEFFHQLQTNPLSILGESKEEVKDEPVKHENSSVDDNGSQNDPTEVPTNEKADPVTTMEPANNLNGFEKELWYATNFCKSLTRQKNYVPPTKRKRGSTQSKKRKRAESTIPGALNDENDVPVHKSPAWSMMEKMGFKGRLGLKEDGIAEPIPMSQRIANSKEGVGISRRISTDFAEKGPQRDVQTQDELSNEMVENGQKRVSDEESQGIEDPVASGDISGDVCDSDKDEGSKKQPIQDLDLDSNDDNETEPEDDLSDNGRRGIVIDFEALIANAHKRRREAYAALNASKPVFADIDLEKIERDTRHDLCDAELIQNALKKAGAECSEEAVHQMLESLDDAYRRTDKPILNMPLLKAIVECASKQSVRLGVFHRGSLRRLQFELDAVDLLNYVPDISSVAVDKCGTWPYIENVKELLCRVGIRSVQCLVLVDEVDSAHMLAGGIVAGQVLGARTLVIGEQIKRGFLETSSKKAGESPDNNAPSGGLLDIKSDLNTLLERPRKQRKRRRVLAMREEDQQFHCGVLEFGAGSDGVEEDLSLIRFYKNGDLEWVSSSAIAPLARKDYSALQKAGFPALLTPEDVDDINIIAF